MSNEFEDNYDTFHALLDKFTPAQAVKRLEQFMIPPDIIRRIREKHERQVLRIKELEEPRSVVLGNRDTWYTGPRDDDKCWPAMARLLLNNGWPQDPAIDSLDNSSTRIVSLLNHPREPEFSTRGLTVGYVQSGKTTNFTAVMAKAADRGYKLFIVLAGIHNGLRRQTQARLVQQLVEPNPTLWSQLTGLEKDFTPPDNPAAYFGGSNKTHILCVVKKNAPVLRKLVKWLGDTSDLLRDCPALIIDDEADQATVATESINPLILQLLKNLPKSAYLGYTASPFANLLIDPSSKNLYPKDFVVNLPEPSASEGYFGTEGLFGRDTIDGDVENIDDGFDMIRVVPDDDVACVRPAKRSDAEGFTPTITDTLRDAIDHFWLSTAARRVRGTGNPHATMLIHTSVNTAVHESFRAPLEHLRSKRRSSLTEDAALDKLRELWDSETERVPAHNLQEEKVEFDRLLPELSKVLDDCRIIMDNSYSEDRLDYENGPVVAIAVGGNTLSRGLTLEGLSVSYFVRAASAYDTLLQMGRWFGYRKGYADLPRIWMTDELREWFRHLATVEAEMRRDIDLYLTEDKTPLDFAVRLRTHPSLRVTAAAKMKDAVPAASSYGGRRVQTRYFQTDSKWLLNNQEAAKKLVSTAARSGARQAARPGDGRYIFYGVPHEDVLEFLKDYRFHEKSQECDAELITKYIRKRVRSAGALGRWNVAIVGMPAGRTEDNFEFAPGIAVQRIVRSRLDSLETGYVDIKTLMSTRDIGVDLGGGHSTLREKALLKERSRQLPDTGLLLLYPIDKDSDQPEKKLRRPLGTPEHVIGAALVFPYPGGDDSAVEGNYVSADLSSVEVEMEDPSLLEREEA